MAEQVSTGAFVPASDTVACLGWFEGWSDANFPLANNPANNVYQNGNLVSMPYTGTFTTWSVSPGEQWTICLFTVTAPAIIRKARPQPTRIPIAATASFLTSRRRFRW